MGKAALRATRHDGHDGHEWVSQIGKNPQMKVVLIFLNVPVFSSEGWLSTIKVKLKGEKTIETVSS